MWSAGCIFAELFIGIPLFPGENEQEQMKYFIKTIGQPSTDIALSGERSDIFFDENGEVLLDIMHAKSIEHF